MNEYEQKQAARRARYEKRALAASVASDAMSKEARKMSGVIPFGQPILIGHHSEGRDRRYRASINNKHRAASALADKAEYYARRTDAVGTGGISSDDPDALQKLKRELADLLHAQEKMKAANKAIRRGDKEALASLGFSAADIKELFTPDPMGCIGFPSCALSNNRANARRIEGRIRELEQAAQLVDVEEEGDDYTYRLDASDRRVMFIFPGKPDSSIHALLKRNGFKWSPRRSAWVRMVNNAALYAAKEVRQVLDGAGS